jgi:glycosyltransferase involved in cell wall biosynthesis
MKLHYRELGEGKPFIILHGLFGYSDNWQTHAKYLSQWFKVTLIDQRNHGHSEHSDEMNYSVMSEDIHETMESIGIEHAHIYERSITIVGKLSEQDLLAYYQGARAVVIPSLIEGFSYPALEAHVLGAPVIARPVGAIPEILREYDTVAEDLSFGALVQALRQGLTKQRNSSTSSINIPQVHTVEQSTRELVRFYHEAVGS